LETLGFPTLLSVVAFLTGTVHLLDIIFVLLKLNSISKAFEFGSHPKSNPHGETGVSPTPFSHLNGVSL